MDRKKVVYEEHRYNRGKLLGNSKAGGDATTTVKTNPIEVPEKYPWEIREEVSKAEMKNLIARKPHHQNRKEILLNSSHSNAE